MAAEALQKSANKELKTLQHFRGTCHDPHRVAPDRLKKNTPSMALLLSDTFVNYKKKKKESSHHRVILNTPRSSIANGSYSS